MTEEESSVHIEAPETKVQPEPEKHSWLRDMLYPLNHAISCLFTDSVIQPFVGAWIQQRVQSDKLPKWLSGIFESHDHGPGCRPVSDLGRVLRIDARRTAPFLAVPALATLGAVAAPSVRNAALWRT